MLAVFVVSGCSGSHSTDTIAGSNDGTSTVAAPQTASTAPLSKLAFVVDNAEVVEGGDVTVHGSGCLSPSGDGTPGLIRIGIPVSESSLEEMGASPGVKVGSDGSFNGTFVMTPVMPPGDQELTASCVGPASASMLACNCYPAEHGTTPRTAPVEPDPTSFSFMSAPAPVHVTGATPMAVSPTQVKAGGTVQVRAQCELPGSDYEQFGAWIAPIDEPYQVRWPTVDSGTDCQSSVAVVDLKVDSGLAPGRYEVRAMTSQERTPVVRWFQPVEIEVVAP
jgi:hypothetical protein